MVTSWAITECTPKVLNKFIVTGLLEVINTFPEATEGSVVFGIQYLIKEYLIKQFEKNFFNLPKKEAVEMFYRRVNKFCWY